MHNVSAVAERGWGGTSPPPAGHCGALLWVLLVAVVAEMLGCHTRANTESRRKGVIYCP